MSIELNWIGPFKQGSFKSLLNHEGHDGPHLYLIVQRYDGGHRKVYCGQANPLSSRLSGYLRDWLGLSTWLYDATGSHAVHTPSRQAARRFAAFDELEKLAPVAIAEIKRLEFWVAKCPMTDLDAAEAEVIHQLMLAGTHKIIACENTRKEPREEVQVVHGFPSKTDLGDFLRYTY